MYTCTVVKKYSGNVSREKIFKNLAVSFVPVKAFFYNIN